MPTMVPDMREAKMNNINSLSFMDFGARRTKTEKNTHTLIIISQSQNLYGTRSDPELLRKC